jgi:hypothetical protein
MRGWIRIILMFAVVAGSAAALAPSGRAALPPCPPGTTNPLYCQLVAPAVVVQGLGASCHRSKPVAVRATVTASSGLKSVRVTVDGHTVKTQKSGKVRLSVATKGLKAGVHTIKIVATDKLGKKTTRTLHFYVCRPKPLPAFTG